MKSGAARQRLYSLLMKTASRLRLPLAVLALSGLLSSCVVDPYNTGYAYGPAAGCRTGYGPRPPAEGTVTGALLGAAAGGIIGNQSGRGLEGAALGGLLGAFAGGALQNARQPRYGSGYASPWQGGSYGAAPYCAPSQTAWRPGYPNPDAYGW
jgi:hypothetical protein